MDALAPLSLDVFRASAHPPTDAEWAEIVEACSPTFPRDAFVCYAEGWTLHRDGDTWFPHAWWYAPVAKATLAEAEADLLAWRDEFVG